MTSHLSKLISTDQVTKQSEYFDTPKKFFGNFPSAWKSVESQVLKLETRQVYKESDNEIGNESFQLFLDEKYAEARSLIYHFRSRDVDLYSKLKKRKIDFIRCRPVEFPVTSYLRWEIQCYHFNSFHGEKIFFLKRSDLDYIFEKVAIHDFMVFDRKIAFVHNYDESGEIQGGWVVTKQEMIDHLIMLYSIIRANSIEYKSFIEHFPL